MRWVFGSSGIAGRWPCAALAGPVRSGFRVSPRVRSPRASTPRRPGIPEAGVRLASNQSSPRSTGPMATPRCLSRRRSSEQGHDGVSKRDPPTRTGAACHHPWSSWNCREPGKCDHAQVPPCRLRAGRLPLVYRAPCRCGESAAQRARHASAGGLPYRKRGEPLFFSPVRIRARSSIQALGHSSRAHLFLARRRSG